MSVSLNLYYRSAQSAQQQALSEAIALLQQAFTVQPPATLSDDECRALQQVGDDLTYVGQLLPCVSPTLQLLRRWQQIGHMN